MVRRRGSWQTCGPATAASASTHSPACCRRLVELGAPLQVWHLAWMFTAQAAAPHGRRIDSVAAGLTKRLRPERVTLKLGDATSEPDLSFSHVYMYDKVELQRPKPSLMVWASIVA